MASATLRISGMHCGACVAHVERSLRRVPGVRDAHVNLATGEGRVEFDDAVSDLSVLQQAVTRGGYRAEALAAGPEPAAPASPAAAGSVASSSADEQRALAASWRRRFIFAGVLALPVVVLAMTWMSLTSAWVQFALTTPVQVVLGGGFVLRAARGVRRARFDMDALVAVGTTAAYAWSVWALLRSDPHVYFDTAGVILTLIALGRWLEARARAQAGEALAGLLKLLPRTAEVLGPDGRVSSTAVERVKAGDTLVVRPGARVPVDGVVLEGVSDVEEALVSGESTPAPKAAGDQVVAGSLNQTGALTIRSTRVGAGTTIAAIDRLVREAQGKRADVQRLADRIAGVFVPVVLAIAACTLVGWGLLGGDGGWATGVWAGVAVLIVSCPCALGLAAPMAVMVGTSAGARSGIIIKDPAAFERAGALRVIILDKTGTLTLGRPGVVAVRALDGRLEDDVDPLALAAAVETRSEHPLARAIVEHARDRGLALSIPTNTRAVPGVGVWGEVSGQLVGVVRVDAAPLSPSEGAQAEALAREHPDATIVAVLTGPGPGNDAQPATSPTPRALIAIADRPRADARGVVDELRALGLTPMLLTGDATAPAAAIARAMGIDRWHAGVRPEDKQRITAEHRPGVAMVGDGVNDAPALAAADVGIAMGSGADVAADAAHIVLVGGELAALPRAIRLSRAMMRRIRLGLVWAFLYNIVLIPLAAAAVLHPMLAALAMSLSSVSVVLNALMLRGSPTRSRAA